MRAVIWKELRENLKWAAVGLLGISTGMAVGLGLDLEGGRIVARKPWALVADDFLIPAGFGAALLGLLLGFLQVVLESGGDRWALLVHRPLSRSRIFAGKVVAGLGLYFLAAGVPFGLACWWAVTPGHVAGPVNIRMMLPGLIEILAGVAYYFAGMLTGIRRARWYASRGLGIGMAVAVSLVVAVLPRFWSALSVVAVASGVLAVAAWGSFLRAGRYGSQPAVARAALCLSLMAGLTVVGSVVVTAVTAVTSLVSRRDVYTYRRYQVDRDGTILRVTYEEHEPVLVADLEGRPLEKYQDRLEDWSWLDRHWARLEVLTLTSAPAAEGVHDRYHYWRDHGVYPLYWGKQAWYYVRDDALVHVYDTREVRLVGYVGPDTPSPRGEKPLERFASPAPISYVPSQVLAFPGVMYRITGSGGGLRLQEVFTAAEDEPVRDVGALFSGGADSESPRIAVATSRRIHVLSPDGAPLFSAALSRDPGASEALRLGALEGGRYIVWYGGSHVGPSDKALVEILSPGGEVEKRMELADPEWEDLSRPAAWEGLVGVLIPLLFAGGLELSVGWTGRPVGMLRSGALQPELWPFLIVSAVACAAAAYVICRRYAFSAGRRVLWSCLALLLGPLGLLTLVCVEEWPAREVCASCGKLRLTSREACEHCQAAWPAPARDGTEIFA